MLFSKVNARWLTDLDRFNEWMNEEDYELTQAEIEVGSICHNIVHDVLERIRDTK